MQNNRLTHVINHSMTISMKRLRLVACCLLFTCLLNSFVQAATINVNAPDGAIADDGLCSISEAIINANDDAATHADCVAGSGADTINLTVDITLTQAYENDATFGRTGTPAISSAIIIDGLDHILQRDNSIACNIDSSNTATEFRLMRNFNGNLTLQNITLAHGCIDHANHGGAGLFNIGDLTINKVKFEQNQALTSGAGLAIGSGTVTEINNSHFSGNQTNSNGGAIYLSTSTIETIQNTTFSDNSAVTTGGAIHISSGLISTIQDSTFSGNSAGDGGAFYIGAFPTSNITNILDSTFVGNSASNDGGAIFHHSGLISTIQNNTFSGNNAGNRGGAIANFNLITSIDNTTFSGNSAILDGGAIYNRVAINTIQNSLFNNNGSNECFGTSSISTNNISTDSSSDCHDASNPLTASTLGPLADNGGTTMTHALLAGSEAIDAGDSNSTLTDQRGFAAISTRDIGAFEYYTALDFCPTALQTDGFSTTVVDADELIQAIQCANLNGEANGGDTINLGADINLTVVYDSDSIWGKTGTPLISTSVVIDGNGFILQRDSALSCNINGISQTGEFRLLRVLSGGDLDLKNTVLRGGCIDGNDGSLPTNISAGIYNDGLLSIRNSFIDNNHSFGAGGGIYNGNRITLIENSTFSGNSSNNGAGGGISNGFNADIDRIQNSTFSGNSSLNWKGGGIFNESNGTIDTIQNSTFSGNSAGSGNGIHNSGNINMIQDTLFHNNSGCFDVGTIFNGSDNLADSTSTGCPGLLATTLTTATIGPLADNGCTTPLADGSCPMTHALLAGSVALNLSVSGPANDQRGFAADGVRDIGAFEAQIPVVTAPANVNVEATGATTSPALGTATATDADSDDLALTIGNDAPASFAVGIHTVTWTATDNHGHQNTDTQIVNVQAVISGTVNGLNGTVILQINGSDNLSINTDGGFRFVTALNNLSNYAVTVLTQPTIQTCTITNANGQVNGNNISDIIITCVDNTLGLNTSSLDYGSVFIGENSTQVTTLTNTGSGDIIISSYTLPNTPFSIVGGSCLTTPVTLMAGQSCDYIIEFRPTNAGGFTGSFNVVSNTTTSPTTISLAGSSTLRIIPTLNFYGMLLMLALFISFTFYRSQNANKIT